MGLYGEELDALCHQGAEQPGQGGQVEDTQREDGEALQSLWWGNIHREPVRLRRAEDRVSHVRAHGVTSGAQEDVTTNTSAVEGNKCTSFLQSLRHLRGGVSAG